MKKRIFIESDILHGYELNSARREASRIIEQKGDECINDVFDHAIDYAWHDLEKTWAFVKNADEIYADTSLMPLVGHTYMGAPVIFNGMMERAIKEKIKGKDVYIFREQKDICWDMIEIPLIKKAFKYNNLFMYNDDRIMVKVDIKTIKK